MKPFRTNIRYLKRIDETSYVVNSISLVLSNVLYSRSFSGTFYNNFEFIMLIASFFVTRIPHSFYSLELFCTFKTSDEKSNFILKFFIRNVGLYKILKENQKKINFLKLFKLLCLALIIFCYLCTNLYPKM